MSDEYVIFGAGSFAQLITEYLSYSGQGSVAHYLIDDRYVGTHCELATQPIGWSQFCAEQSLAEQKIIFAVGYDNLDQKKQCLQRLLASDAQLINLNLSSDVLAPIDWRGTGNVILPGAIIEPSVTIGSGNIFWSGSHICHDVRIGDYNFFAAKSVIGGRSKIGNCNFFGFSSVIRDHIQIGDQITVGMGGVVPSDLSHPGIYTGMPVKQR